MSPTNTQTQTQPSSSTSSKALRLMRKVGMGLTAAAGIAAFPLQLAAHHERLPDMLANIVLPDHHSMAVGFGVSLLSLIATGTYLCNALTKNKAPTNNTHLHTPAAA